MQTSDDTLPLVNVVIPTKNSEKTLGKCLSSLSNQSYPKDKFKVIIIDDSTDSTPTIISSFTKDLNIEELLEELLDERVTLDVTEGDEGPIVRMMPAEYYEYSPTWRPNGWLW